MKSLFNITTEQQAITEQLIESGGELTPELETAIAFNQEELQVKGTAYGHVIHQLEAEEAIIDAEISRLQGLKKSRQNAQERLKSALKFAMETFGIEKIDGPLIKICFRKSKSVEITDQDQIPAEYMVTKTTTTPDRLAIKKAIKEGKLMAGAYIKESQNLQIK